MPRSNPPTEYRLYRWLRFVARPSNLPVLLPYLEIVVSFTDNAISSGTTRIGIPSDGGTAVFILLVDTGTTKVWSLSRIVRFLRRPLSLPSYEGVGRRRCRPLSIALPYFCSSMCDSGLQKVPSVAVGGRHHQASPKHLVTSYDLMFDSTRVSRTTCTLYLAWYVITIVNAWNGIDEIQRFQPVLVRIDDAKLERLRDHTRYVAWHIIREHELGESLRAHYYSFASSRIHRRQSDEASRKKSRFSICDHEKLNHHGRRCAAHFEEDVHYIASTGRGLCQRCFCQYLARINLQSDAVDWILCLWIQHAWRRKLGNHNLFLPALEARFSVKGAEILLSRLQPVSLQGDDREVRG